MAQEFYKQATLPELTADDPDPILPKKIGPYKIESQLSKGGMSFLYLASHPGSSKPLVIKILSPKYFMNKEMASRFLKEAQIISMTNHPNIVKLYGQGQWEKGLYIAMEFIQGISLRQFLQQKSLSTKKALEIILQVAYALCHLHTHGVIHRDLKPENILITETGEIKVIDFGIAQLDSELDEASRTEKRSLMGTPVYMSPEQKLNSFHVSYASDIYSLGIIAYELVLGKLSHGTIHLSLLPKNLHKIIEKALQPNVSDRYQDMVDFITDVSQHIRLLSQQVETPTEESSDEMHLMVQHARSLLIPKKSFRWPHAEIEIASSDGGSLSSLYLDFFRLSNNRLAIVLAESLEGGIHSLFHCALLRGSIRMAMELFIKNGKKDHHPVKMLNALNASLCDETMKERFGLSLLVLNPEKDQFSFISCNYTPLWQLSEGGERLRKYPTPNPALGADPNAIFLETANNWSPKDSLFLHSSSLMIAKEDAATLFEPDETPQPRAEKLLQKLTRGGASQKRTSLVLSIQRVF